MAKEFVKRNIPSVVRGAIFHEHKEDQQVLIENDACINYYGSSTGITRTSSDFSDHCHGPSEAIGVDKNARKKLLVASILCLIFMIGEIVGGAMASSLAIMTDAAHLLTDFASFMISLFAIYLASRPATKRMSFGWHRAEVVGALVSVLMIWVVTGILVYLAVMRVVSMEFKIEGGIMLITSIAGIIINLIMAATLHQHGHTHGSSKSNNETDKEHGHSHGKSEKENINVRAAFIHVIGDLVQSIGVFIAALVIYLKPKYKIADPICTFIFSILVLITTINILRDTMVVLMEGTPKDLDFNEVKAAFYDLPGVIEVHNLRMWSLTISKTALSVHIAIDPDQETHTILRDASNMLRQRFQIADVTIQLENYVSEMAECQQCQDPAD
uniref:Slc30a-8 n=1 Tax=Schmidtea mediterranea TaxID=79327 RepID=A0A0H3YKE4_SCHMD|nr:slc30a-8 [Schmidtea mediterranea]